MNKKIGITILFTCLLLSTYAYNEVNFIGYKGYGDDPGIVANTTRVGDYVGYFIIGIPAAIVSEPVRLFEPNTEYSDPIGYYMTYGVTKTFGAAFGFIPWCFKSIFYTPFTSNKKHPKIKDKRVILPWQLLRKENVTPITNLALPVGDTNGVFDSDDSRYQTSELPNQPAMGAGDGDPIVENLAVPSQPDIKKQIKDMEETIGLTPIKDKKPAEAQTAKEKTPEKVEVSQKLPSWVKQEVK